MANRSFLAPPAHEWLQGIIRGLIAPREANGPEQLNQAILQLEADLARYYFRFVELRVPGLDVDRVATVAWWAARQISGVMADQAMTAAKPGRFVRLIHRRAVRPALLRSELEWHASHPRSGDASIRFGTLFCSQPRLLALLIRASGFAGALGEGLSVEDAQAITGAFIEHQMGCFPVESVSPENAVWAFDTPLAPAFEDWILSSAVAPEDREKLAQLLGIAGAVGDTKRLVQDMRSSGEQAEATRHFLFHLFRVVAYCRSDAAEPLWQLAMDPAWRATSFDKMPLQPLHALFDGIVEVSRRVTDERTLELPHIFAEQYEKHEADSERRSWFFALAVLASVGVGKVSAVRRIVGRPNRDRSSIEYWSKQIRAVLPLSPPALQGTLRDVLSSLAST